MKYIALLRGVNVGGNNKLPMPALKAAFIRAGFSDAATYINSGNVVFSGPETDLVSLAERCQAIIRDEFRLDIAVCIVAAEELRAALAHAPPWWNADPEAKHNAIFVIPPATAEDIFAQVGAIKPEYERVDFYGRVIFWTAPLRTFSKTRWSKIVGTAAYRSVTIRNANTAVALSRL